MQAPIEEELWLQNYLPHLQQLAGKADGGPRSRLCKMKIRTAKQAGEKDGVTLGYRHGVLGVFVLVVYVYTAIPSVPGGDAGELLASGCQLGTPHPPGEYMMMPPSPYILDLNMQACTVAVTDGGENKRRQVLPCSHPRIKFQLRRTSVAQ